MNLDLTYIVRDVHFCQLIFPKLSKNSSWGFFTFFKKFKVKKKYIKNCALQKSRERFINVTQTLKDLQAIKVDQFFWSF